eukprot:jgi/Psemu1/821/gm1.821_g
MVLKKEDCDVSPTYTCEYYAKFLEGTFVTFFFCKATTCKCLCKDSPRLRVLQNFTRHESRFSDGYNSDGEKGPFFDAIWAEGDQHREESEQSFHFGPDTAAAVAEEDKEDSLSSDEEEDLSSAQEEEEEADDDKNLQKKSVVWL